jgi:hypothetical protein
MKFINVDSLVNEDSLKKIYGELLRSFNQYMHSAIDIMRQLDVHMKDYDAVKIHKILKDYNFYLGEVYHLHSVMERFLRVNSCNEFSCLQQYKDETSKWLVYLNQTVSLTEHLYQQAKQMLPRARTTELTRTYKLQSQMKSFHLTQEDLEAISVVQRSCMLPDIHAILRQSISVSHDVTDLKRWLLDSRIIQSWMRLAQSDDQLLSRQPFFHHLIQFKQAVENIIKKELSSTCENQNEEESVFDRVMKSLKKAMKSEDSSLHVNHMSALVTELFVFLFHKNGHLNKDVLFISGFLLSSSSYEQLNQSTISDERFRVYLKNLIKTVLDLTGIEGNCSLGGDLVHNLFIEGIVTFYNGLIDSASEPFRYILPPQHLDYKTFSAVDVISNVLPYANDEVYKNINFTFHVSSDFMNQYANIKCFPANVSFSSDQVPVHETLSIVNKKFQKNVFDDNCLHRLRQYAGCWSSFNVIPYCRKHHLQRAQVLLRVLSSEHLCVQDKLACVEYQLSLYESNPGTGDLSKSSLANGSVDIVPAPCAFYANRFKQAFRGGVQYLRLHRAFKHQGKLNGGYFRILNEIKQSLKSSLPDHHSTRYASSAGHNVG